MTYEEISQLLKNHTSIRLLKADHAPLIISFLFSVFKGGISNQEEGGVKEKELAGHLSDNLYVSKDIRKILSTFTEIIGEIITDMHYLCVSGNR